MHDWVCAISALMKDAPLAVADPGATQRADMTEIFELTPLDQALLTFETEMAAAALKKVTGATKINIGALGNIVRQLHVHVIARFEGDAELARPRLGLRQGRALRSGQESMTFTAKYAWKPFHHEPNSLFDSDVPHPEAEQAHRLCRQTT